MSSKRIHSVLEGEELFIGKMYTIAIREDVVAVVVGGGGGGGDRG
jgi:hypothetical protein